MSAAARAMARADELAACSERAGEITRRYGTPELVAARELLEAWMLQAGLRTRVDRAGNLIGTLGAGERPAVVIGSHFDTVVDAGRYDGNLGILLGIGCAEELAGADPAHDLTVVAFCDEEGTRFPTAYFGSRAFLGAPLPDGALTDAEGATLAAGIDIAGNAAAEPGSGLPANAVAYLEAHIEQGPVLEAQGHPLGIVTAITGGAKLTVTLTGTAGHAGTVPMGLRRDAFSAAAEIALAVERLARDDGEAVATVGEVAVAPGAANVIPGRAAISIDLRHPDDGRRGRLLGRVREIVADVAARRGVEAAVDVVHHERSVVCDRALGERMRRAARSIRLDPPSLASGAGHDAVVLSDHVPVAMLFVRCAGGISHNPAESVTEDDVAAALAVLTAVVRSAG
ncbi:MAG TPA: M20 family metallo-hydrolase [Gaiellales bacterium]|nr:M20 family metallo-hydrolase [Gaiellales bacterium]